LTLLRASLIATGIEGDEIVRTTLIAAALLAAAPAAAANYSNLYVFGDSLVDAGNVTAAFGPGFNPPSQGYFPGRFTNGPDYTDLLNRRIEGSFMTPSLLGGDNFAYGGARSGPGAGVPRLSVQINTYLNVAKSVADPNALYIINMGGNDVFALRSGNTGGLSPAEYTENFLSNIVSGVQTLNEAGARNIVVAGLPFTAATPGIKDLQASLDARLDAIEPSLQGTLFRYSYANTYDKIFADPERYGLTATPILTGHCRQLRPMTPTGRDCTGIFSFDGTHPTAVVHEAFFRDMARLTGVSVPEPSTWAMMIIGFGMVGATLRRRERAAPAA
jgi:phospholipase/lecithinase/hemolysin